MKLIDQINNAILRGSNKIDDAILDYYEENPGELDLIINKEHFYALFLGIVFIVGIIITLATRMIQVYYNEKISGTVYSVILELISELGLAIFGGAVVAFIIELLNKKQYQSNLMFRTRVIKKLKEREQSTDSP